MDVKNMNKKLNRKLIIINILLIIAIVELFIHTGIINLVLVGYFLMLTLAVLIFISLIIYLKENHLTN